MTAKKKSSKTTKKKSKSTKDKDDLVSLDEQLKHEKDKNLRLFAEFDNFRKRKESEKQRETKTKNPDKKNLRKQRIEKTNDRCKSLISLVS